MLPDWYPMLLNARYARMSPVDYLALPVHWQDLIATARAAEIEAGLPTVTNDR